MAAVKKLPVRRLQEDLLAGGVEPLQTQAEPQLDARKFNGREAKSVGPVVDPQRGVTLPEGDFGLDVQGSRQQEDLSGTKKALGIRGVTRREDGSYHLEGTNMYLKEVGEEDIDIFYVGDDGVEHKLEGKEKHEVRNKIHDEVFERVDDDRLQTNMSGLNLAMTLHRLFDVKTAGPDQTPERVAKDKEGRAEIYGGDGGVIGRVDSDRGKVLTFDNKGRGRRVEDAGVLRMMEGNLREFGRNATAMELSNMTLGELSVFILRGAINR